MKQLITFKDFREFFEEPEGDGNFLVTHYKFTYSVLIDGVFKTKCDLFSETLDIIEEYEVGNERVKPYPEYEDIVKNIDEYFVHSVEVEEIRSSDDMNQNAYVHVFLCKLTADITGVESPFNGNNYFKPTRFCDIMPLYPKNDLIDIISLEPDENGNLRWVQKEPNELPIGDDGYFFWYVIHIHNILSSDDPSKIVSQIFLAKEIEWIIYPNFLNNDDCTG